MQLSHSFTALMAFVIIAAAYPAPHLLTTSLARRGVLTSNLDQNTRVVGSPSPLTPLITPNPDSDSPDGVDKRAELDSNFPISSNGPESRDLGAPSAPDLPNTPNKRAELDSTACSAPTLPTSPDESSKRAELDTDTTTCPPTIHTLPVLTLDPPFGDGLLNANSDSPDADSPGGVDKRAELDSNFPSKREEMSKVPIRSLPESQHHASN
ncbi:uncharacterized protein HD556DRAFT_1528085 [Suillus plorans]|uniref:Uncharacterized protein n=1 Tax=Suillus plorans TaxID=116603 RepID=A0A9P7AP00_9AGAM|nr:uncharacterized protein HD556DRAFT_1528085 [Suillus plorans]KAG1792168.1 hypothetical protein HD556DRAFT_1528085 [Suillus plorans]